MDEQLIRTRYAFSLSKGRKLASVRWSGELLPLPILAEASAGYTTEGLTSH